MSETEIVLLCYCLILKAMLWSAIVWMRRMNRTLQAKHEQRLITLQGGPLDGLRAYVCSAHKSVAICSNGEPRHLYAMAEDGAFVYSGPIHP